MRRLYQGGAYSSKYGIGKPREGKLYGNLTPGRRHLHIRLQRFSIDRPQGGKRKSLSLCDTFDSDLGLSCSYIAC